MQALGLHERLGHLAYDTIEHLADDPYAGIRLTDRSRPNCLTCAHDKLTKKAQSKTDTGQHASIDKLHTPLPTRELLHDQLRVTRCNYLGLFLAKNKAEATLNFEHFSVNFDKKFNCRIPVLQTDGGTEYGNVDPFYKANGIRHQALGQRGKQSILEWQGRTNAPHGAEQDVLYAVCVGTTIEFWDYVVEYAAYVLTGVRAA